MLRQVGRNQLVQHQSAGNHAVVHGGILAGKVKVIVQLLHQPHGGIIMDCAVGLAFSLARAYRGCSMDSGIPDRVIFSIYDMS